MHPPGFSLDSLLYIVCWQTSEIGGYDHWMFTGERGQGDREPDRVKRGKRTAVDSLLSPRAAANSANTA